VNVAVLAVVVTLMFVATLTALVRTVNSALVEPAGTVTVDNTAAKAGFALDTNTTNGVVAAPFNVTTPCTIWPPTTVVGFNTKLERVADGATGGNTFWSVSTFPVPQSENVYVNDPFPLLRPVYSVPVVLL
jgi:hypothetical protein